MSANSNACVCVCLCVGRERKREHYVEGFVCVFVRFIYVCERELGGSIKLYGLFVCVRSRSVCVCVRERETVLNCMVKFVMLFMLCVRLYVCLLTVIQLIICCLNF